MLPLGALTPQGGGDARHARRIAMAVLLGFYSQAASAQVIIHDLGVPKRETYTLLETSPFVREIGGVVAGTRACGKYFIYAIVDNQLEISLSGISRWPEVIKAAWVVQRDSLQIQFSNVRIIPTIEVIKGGETPLRFTLYISEEKYRNSPCLIKREERKRQQPSDDREDEALLATKTPFSGAAFLPLFLNV